MRELGTVVADRAVADDRSVGASCTVGNVSGVIVRVAVLPHPPLLVPELAVGADEATTTLRTRCVEVAERLAGAAPHWVAVGADTTARDIAATAAGTFAGYGVDLPVRLGTDEPDPVDPLLPLPALVAGWLRERAGATSVRVRLLAADLSPADCAAEGGWLAAELSGADPVGLLVLGDGSHRHGERAVGRPHERAAEFDDAVRAAFTATDLDGLLAADPDLADELGVAGRVPWQLLAGVLAAGSWRCVSSELLVPFGVAYHLAEWEPA